MRRLAACLVLALSSTGCLSPRLDAPAKTRIDSLGTAPWTSPFVQLSRSPDGTSRAWSALFGLFGAEVEEQRRLQRALPFYYHSEDPPSAETTLIFPLWYARDEGPSTRTRWYSLLYGSYESPEELQDHYVASLFRWKRSRTADAWQSGLFPLYDWDHRDAVNRFTLVPLLGLAHLATYEWGYPAEGVTVGAEGRGGSRRFELLDVLGAISLLGYDDVGDRREFRILSLFDSEALSLVRSWRGRGEDPFISEWVFPVYMSHADEKSSWSYVGPLWGHTADKELSTGTDWWLLGLVTRHKTRLHGYYWRVLGIHVAGSRT